MTDTAEPTPSSSETPEVSKPTRTKREKKRGPFRFRYLLSPKKFLAWAKIPDPFELKLLANTSMLQYATFQFFAVSVLLAMPVKLFLRLVFTIKYVWVTPWFNV